MKKLIVVFGFLAILITSCTLPTFNKQSSSPSVDDIQTAIAQTQQIEGIISTGIAQTLAVAVTNTPEPTYTTVPTNTILPPTLTPTVTVKPYLSPTPTLYLQLTLETINKCDYPVDVKITGPMSWSITIPAHTKDSRQIVRGTYHFWNSKGQDFDYDLRVAHWLWIFCPNGYYN